MSKPNIPSAIYNSAPLTPTTVQTSAYTATANQLVPVSASTAAITVTLPTAPADKTRVTVKKIDATTNIVTVTAGGSDVFNKAGGNTTISLSLQNQSVNLQYASAGSIWYVVSDGLPLTALNATYSLSGGAVDTKGDVGQDGILVIGQSNAAGRATGYDLQRTDPIDPRIHQYAPAGPYALADSIAVEPLYNPEYGIATSTLGVGPGLPFAREWVKRAQPYRTPCIIGAAFGGTGFEGADSHGTTRQWKVGATGNTQNLYEAAIAQAQAWLATNPANRIVAMLWIQGEQDAANGTSSATYTTDLDTLIAGFRSRLSIPTVPFIVGQMTPEAIGSGSGYAAINSVHIDTPRRNQYAAFVYGIGRGYTDPVNGTIHWGLAGQHYFGTAMYAAVARAAANVTGNAPITPTTAPTITQTAATTAAASWPQPVCRVTGFVVELNTGSGWSTVSRSSTLIDVNQALTGLSAGQTVQVRYSIVNEQGTSSPSPVGSLLVGNPPNAPTSLTLGTTTGTSQALSWTAPATDGTHPAATSYTVYKSTDSGTTFTFASSVTTTSCIVSGLTVSTAYVFKVTGSNINGEGAASNTVSVTTAAAATSFVYDTFTDTAGTSLVAHTGETGATWAKSGATPSGSMVITAAGRLRNNVAGGSQEYASGTSGSDYTVEADFYFASLIAGSSTAIWGRGSTTSSSSTGYRVVFVVSTGLWRLDKVVNGTTTTLGTYTPSASPVAGDTVHAKLVMAGTTISMVVDGATQVSVTDASVTAAGNVNVQFGGSTNFTETTGIQLDNLAAS